MKSTVKKSLTLILCLLLVIASLSIAPVTADDTAEEVTTNEVEMKREFNKAKNFKSLGMNGTWSIAYEDSYSQLLVDTTTAAVAVLDKASGHIWKTNPTQAELDADSGITPMVKAEALSQVILSYCDANNYQKTFTSYTDGVSEGKYEINNIENGVMVQYNIGVNADDFFFPVALRESTYNELIAKMDESTAKKFAGYYKFYDYQNLDPASELALKTKYPILKSESVYESTLSAKRVKTNFVKETLYDLDIDEDWIVNEYTEIGFTGYSVPDASNFDVTINYTLENGKLNVTIPEDGIVYTSKQCTLTDITLLPYFGSEVGMNSGKFFIPDGSGALLDVQQEASFILSLPFYGNDYSMRTKDYAEFTQQATLPVYGIISGTDAVVANVVSGSEVGSVEAHLRNSIYPIPRITTSYSINEFEEYSSQGQVSTATLIKYSKEMYNRPISIDYYFLTGNKANYVGMASKIRDVYFADKERVSDDQTQFILETYGAAIRKEYFFGYPLSKFTTFTSVTEAQTMYDELTAAGIGNIDVKYNNWSVDKYRNDIAKIGNLSNKVASASEWTEFQSYLKNAGSNLYVNADLVLDKNGGSSFGASWHSKEMDGMLVEYSGSKGVYTMGVTDSVWMTVIKSTESLKRFDSILSKLKKLEIESVCYDTIGEHVFSDYNSSKERLRDEVVSDYKAILAKADEAGQNIMVSKGNAYTFDYADVITELPMGDSRYYYEEQIPFLQIVLHGYISYTGQAVNLADSVEINYLKSVEYGAGLKYVLNEIESKLIKDTNYSNLYTTQFARWKEDAIKRYIKLEEAIGGTQSSVIVNHEKLQNNVYRTTYENGVYVIVNYNDYDVTVDGMTVGATDFIHSNK